MRRDTQREGLFTHQSITSFDATHALVRALISGLRLVEWNLGSQGAPFWGQFSFERQCKDNKKEK